MARPFSSWSFFLAVLGFNFTALASDDDDASEVVRLSEYEFSGETRTCLTYTRLDGWMALTNQRFLFQERGVFYINDAQSECAGVTNSSMRTQFRMKTGRVCKNTLVYVYTPTDDNRPFGRCALSEFKELQRKQVQSDIE